MSLRNGWTGDTDINPWVPQRCYGPLAAIAAGAAAIGTGISAYGTIAGGKSQQTSANYQAGQLDEQAEQVRAQADLTRQKADLTRQVAKNTRVQADYTRERADQIREQAEGLAAGEKEAGKQELANAQVEAGQYKRRKDLVASSQQARGAASGLMTTDPTSLALADEVAKYGTLQEKMAVFSGTYARAGREARARTIKHEGAIAGRNTDVQAYMTDVDAGMLDRQADMTDIEAYNIDRRARSVNAQAEGVRYEGRVAKKSSNLKAIGTILGGASTLAGRFNPGSSGGDAGGETVSRFRYGG